MLKGKTAVVTGGADGIGKAAALKLASAGANVVIGDIEQDKGERVAAAIAAEGGEAHFVRCDVGRDEDVRRLIEEAASRYGSVDILHNNAGIDMCKPFLVTTEADWSRVLNVNLISVLRGCHYAVPFMIRAGGGCIVNTSSAQAHRGYPGYSVYAASKGGIHALTRQLAVELGSYGIRVNSVSPGAIATAMTEQSLAASAQPEELLHEYVSGHVMQRLGLTEEVADAVLFLASPQSAFLTGVDIPVDGGLQAKPPGVV